MLLHEHLGDTQEKNQVKLNNYTKVVGGGNRMEARAIAKYIRISPRKMKPITDLVRGKNANEAIAILKFTPRKGASILKKVIESAMANAENNHGMDGESLFVSEVYANQGPTMKRWKAGSMGRANPILRRTSHIGVVLKEKE